MQITVWSTKNCVQCMATKRRFDSMGINYVEKSLEDNPEQLQAFKDAGLLQAPIVTTDTKVWSGYRDDKIKSLGNYLFGENNK